VSPSSYPANNNNQTMLINGSNFQSGATVTFHDPQGNSYPNKPASFVSSSQLSLTFNNGNDAGTWTVFVTNPDTQVSNTLTFTVTSPVPPPSIGSLSPSSYPANNNNQTMLINGSNFPRNRGQSETHEIDGCIEKTARVILTYYILFAATVAIGASIIG
jgi:hypothetical protein